MSTQVLRIFDILHHFKAPNHPKGRQPGLWAFRNGSWIKWDYQGIMSGISMVREWLDKQGFVAGDRILTMPEQGAPEWLIIEMACWMNKLVVVPVHTTQSDAVIQEIFELVNPVYFITTNHGQYNKLRYLAPKGRGGHLECRAEHVLPFLMGMQQPRPRPCGIPDISKVGEEEVACIMFTSGTTGMPKGAVLTHHNIVSNVKAVGDIVPLKPGHRVLSFLPYSHIFERTACLTYLYLGVDVYFTSGKEHLLRDFQQVKPHFFTAVPRMLEKTYDYVIGMQLSANPLKRWVSRWAIRVGRRYGTHKGRGWLYGMKLWASRVLYFSFWHRRMGGHVRWVAVGAAALPPTIGRLFGAAGVKIREGYGMTETSPVISFNPFQKGSNVPGSVGLPIKGVQVRLDKESEESAYGEICVKGPNVMKGYFNNPEATKRVFTPDGWLRTGDIGMVDEAGYLYITDRAKDIFKTSSGKYISPAKMEQRMCESAYIHQSLYIGANRAYPAAIIVPNFLLLKKWAKRSKIHWTAPQFMVHNVMIRKKLQEQIDDINRTLPNYKRIRDFVLCHEPWTVEQGDISASLKIIRKKLLSKYAKQIDKLYPEYHRER